MLWFVQRRVSRGGRRRDSEPIRVVAKQGLGGKTQLVIAEIDGMRYVLGVSERSVSVIDRLPPRDILRSQTATTPESATPEDLVHAAPLRRSRPRTPSFGAEMARTLRRSIGA